MKLNACVILSLSPACRQKQEGSGVRGGFSLMNQRVFPLERTTVLAMGVTLFVPPLGVRGLLSCLKPAGLILFSRQKSMQKVMTKSNPGSRTVHPRDFDGAR